MRNSSPDPAQIFLKVFENTHIPMVVSSFDTGIIHYVNQVFLEMFGFTSSEVIGKTIKDLEIYVDYSERVKAMDIFRKYGKVVDFEILLKSRSGELLECLFTVDSIDTESGSYILTAATNVSSLKRIEAGYKNLFSQQKLIADITQLLNRTLDPRRELNNVLRTIGEVTNVSRVYIFEDHPCGVTTSNTYEWVNKGIEPVIEYQQNIEYSMVPGFREKITEEGRLFSKDIEELGGVLAEYFRIQNIKSILVYPMYINNKYCGFIGFDECTLKREWRDEELDLLKAVSNIIANAFEKMAALEKIQTSEVRLKSALESANEGLWEWDTVTNETYFSDIWYTMLGYKPNEFPAKLSFWEKLVHPDDMERINELLARHLSGESEKYEAIYRVKTKSGKWIWILDHGKVVERDASGAPLKAIGTHIDVTSQKETEEKLKELINTRNKLFSVISHDLRGPIGNILPVLDLLTEEGESIDRETQNALMSGLKESAGNAYKLLENLLMWSRSQTGVIKIEKENIDIGKLINENVRLAESQAASKEIKISATLGHNIFAYADMNSADLVIRNLISNSVKFTRPGGNIYVEAQKSDSYIIVSIRDTGIGMSPEILAGLFTINPLHHATGTANEPGSGLGLVLCREFIEKNGGTIKVESIEEKGSTFTFTLPAV
jgi:PAS domain S-box-containing protein